MKKALNDRRKKSYSLKFYGVQTGRLVIRSKLKENTASIITKRGFKQQNGRLLSCLKEPTKILVIDFRS